MYIIHTPNFNSNLLNLLEITSYFFLSEAKVPELLEVIIPQYYMHSNAFSKFNYLTIHYCLTYLKRIKVKMKNTHFNNSMI